MPEAVEYSITITFEPQTLAAIKEDKNKVLALVRDMGVTGGTENGNIVFATFSSEELAISKTFTWKEEYTVQETSKKFQNGGTVESGTNQVSVLRGQTVAFQGDSIGKAEGESNPTGNITVVNNWANLACVVVGCKSSITNEFVPHYISAPRTVGDASELTPVQSFSVLVTSHTKTKTMIDVTKGRPGHFEINAGKNACTIHYDTYSGDIANQWTSVENATKLP